MAVSQEIHIHSGLTAPIYNYDSFSEFANFAILPGGRFFESAGRFIFRGVSRSSYQLLPKALREDESTKLRERFSASSADARNSQYSQIIAEHRYLRDFCRIANREGLVVPGCSHDLYGYLGPSTLGGPKEEAEALWLSEDITELAALAQHYGAPTRMLDWTFDINVAIYFACKSFFAGKDLGDETHLSIWALNASHIDTLNENEFTVPVRFVVPLYNSNPNIAAQKGVLSYWSTPIPCLNDNSNSLKKRNEQPIDARPLEELLIESFGDEGPMTLLYKFNLPITERKAMLEYIARAGYGSAKLFPGYGGVIDEMREAALLKNANL